jgi:hypothetical protein
MIVPAAGVLILAFMAATVATARRLGRPYLLPAVVAAMGAVMVLAPWEPPWLLQSAEVVAIVLAAVNLIAGRVVKRPTVTDLGDGRYSATLTMRPPPRWLSAYRRWRWPNGTWPEEASQPWWDPWFAVLFGRIRWAQRWYAQRHRYFWLPCPLCDRPFGGHEWRPVAGRCCTVPDPLDGPGRSVGICPDCTRAGRGRETELGQPDFLADLR